MKRLPRVLEHRPSGHRSHWSPAGVQRRHPEAQFIDWDFGKRIILVGCLTAGVALSAFAYEWDIAHNLSRARAVNVIRG